jgi:hypothetical protein
MTVLRDVLVVLHILGLAAIIGPWLAAPREPRIRMAMVWGARAQVVTGMLLVAVHQMSDDPADRLNPAKIGVKLVVAVACTACAEVANGRQHRATTAEPVRARGVRPATAGSGALDRGSAAGAAVPAAALVQAAALLAVVNVCVAIFWV